MSIASRTFLTVFLLLATATEYGCVLGRRNEGRDRETSTARTPTTASTASTRPAMGALDRQFVIQATSACLFQAEVSKLALQKTYDPRAVAGAQSFLDDYSSAGDELDGIARQRGFRLPQEMNSRHRAMYDRLVVLDGKTFADTYAATRSQTHREMLDLFFSEANNGTDPDVKAFATALLPKIQVHLKGLLETAGPMMKESKPAAG